MRFDLGKLDAAIGYKLLTATVTPRPIAWVTSCDTNGVVNAAPYSFFNAVGHRPPMVVLGMLRDPEKGLKDTCQNILDTGEFVVNLVPARLAAQMNATCAAFPRGVSEIAAAGLAVVASLKVAPPRIAQAPVALECTLFQAVGTGPEQTLAIGRVRMIHVADEFVLDAGRGHVDTPALDLIARMHGSGWYMGHDGMFRMARPG